MRRRVRLLRFWLILLLAAAPGLAESLDHGGLRGACTPGATVLCFQDGRFRAEVDWEDFDGNTGEGQVLPVGSDDTGFFWFVDPELPEIYLRVIDGTIFNGFYWVFLSSLTNWQYTLTVTDTTDGSTKQYFNPLGVFTTVTDTEAFPDVPPVAPRPRGQTRPQFTVSSDGSGTVTAVKGGSGGTCLPSDTVLCLDGDRFQVEVDWRDFESNTGPGHGQPLTPRAGWFWFFSPTNFEMVVKVVDGGADNGHFWFYYGTLTSVEYTITVTDTCSGVTKAYFNPLGVLTSSADFEAFPSVPCSSIFADGFESGDTAAWSSTTGN